jgi:hypothetical protein
MNKTKTKGSKGPKIKGLFGFTFDVEQTVDVVVGEDLASAVLKEVDGGPEVGWRDCRRIGNSPKRLKFKGTPFRKKKTKSKLDVPGDLTVTIEPDTAPSFSVSNVIYLEP